MEINNNILEEYFSYLTVIKARAHTRYLSFALTCDFYSSLFRRRENLRLFPVFPKIYTYDAEKAP